MNYDKNAREVLALAGAKAEEMRHQFITPEHLLLAMVSQSSFQKAMFYCNIDFSEFLNRLEALFDAMEKLPSDMDVLPEASFQTEQLINEAFQHACYSDVDTVGVPHLLNALFSLEESDAVYLLLSSTDADKGEIVNNVLNCYEEDGFGTDDDYETNDGMPGMDRSEEPWRAFVVCVNDHLEGRPPLIGRESELQRTMQVLCRRDKNNPLHIGEPGVGKTALVYGLASMIERGDVPERLKGMRIYQMNVGDLLAGTQFRGDFEKRLKMIMDALQREGNAIVYIDEMHNLVGAGQTGEGSMDASNMLKPYFEQGDIRFIGSTTYQEYNRYMAKSRSLMRRFQQIDITEPTQAETVNILNGLKQHYEQYHGVKYGKDVVEYAVEMAARHITDRFLPDKAIDLIDEAGAMAELACKEQGGEDAAKKAVIGIQDIRDVLQRICKIDAAALRDDDNSKLEDLEQRISDDIYGQEEAVRQVVQAVQMSKAGLSDDEKPIASLLFVGPTGVGKTEVARVLARELGIELVRFDMSEYTEKHTVAKLIGSPAGYVGYEDGGLLTDAIRKTPNCVLLLDEIEKAHQDIYNILLQVMDYGRLTDNRGQKSDFRNVVLIMTSNAGAQYASQASVGFGSTVTAADAMMRQVRKTFKPEFLNRLSSTVLFRDMDLGMASQILDKKLRKLHEKLSARKVSLTLADDARQWLLERGFTRQYGAREMDRVLQQHLHPLLMREILFGSLVGGGKVKAVLKDNAVVLQKVSRTRKKAAE